jgi:hypothetical protein
MFAFNLVQIQTVSPGISYAAALFQVYCHLPWLRRIPTLGLKNWPITAVESTISPMTYHVYTRAGMMAFFPTAV